MNGQAHLTGSFTPLGARHGPWRPRFPNSLSGTRLLRRQQQCGAVACSFKSAKPKLVYMGVAAVDQALDGVSSKKAAWLGAREAGVPLQSPVITRSDTYFEEKGLEFVEGSDGIDITELNELFEKVGFPRREPAKLAIALANTHRVLWVRSTRTSRVAREGQLLGFARATGDGALSATIWDVAVHPAWQRIGLGRALMERLTTLLCQDGIGMITLYAEPGVVSLYERLGFVKDVDGIKGMGFQRKALAALPPMAAVA